MGVEILFLTGSLALLTGALFGYLVRRFIAQQKVNSAEQRAEKILEEAKTKRQEFFLAAKEKGLKIIEEAKHEEQQRRNELREIQRRLDQREAKFDEKLFEFESKEKSFQEKTQTVEQLREDLDVILQGEKMKLQEISGLTREQAEERLMVQVEKDVQEALLSRRKKMELSVGEDLDRAAKLKLAQVMQRYAGSHASDLTTTTLAIPSDEMKGRIIGKEGRNIRVVEQLTGVDIIIDDTPQAITLSSFSPIRREVAKRALRELVEDGRIHPARIEECIARAKKDIALEIKKAGEDVLYELGITGIDPKLVQILGRLKYRTSYGQNVLLHSKEVSMIAAMLAEELGGDVTICKQGGLFHDIGKAVDHDVQGGHPEIGFNIMKKFGFSDEVAYQCIAHHEDSPRSLEGSLVKIADAISGARPGARNDSTEKYLQRLDELEKVASSFNGIEKVYAIQAGREVRVFVRPEDISDLESQKLAVDIAKKIEEELRYPGEIKVNIIRETRFIEYAR